MKLGLIETLGAVRGRLPLWERHLARLRAGAERLGIAFTPPPDLRDRAIDVLEDHEHQVLRITLQPGEGGAAEWFFDTKPRPGPAAAVSLVVAGKPMPDDGVPRDLKIWPRPFYDEVLAEAKAAGADDAVILDRDGTVLETAVANLFWYRNGSWHTPAAEGRLLPGIARQVLLAGLRARGEPVQEGRYGLADLAGAEVVALTNAVHGPRPAAVLQDATGRDLGPLPAIWAAAVGSIP